MRTSPSPMRSVRRRRAAAASLLAGLLVVFGAGCSDDDPDADEPSSSPSITEPDDETTTTEAPETTATEASSGPLTDDQVETELRRIFDAYTEAFVGASERGALDEQLHGEISRIMSPELRDNEIDGLNGIGGIDAVVAAPGSIPIADVEVGASIAGCASGSATIDLRAIVGDNVPGPRTMFFKIEPSDASAGTWRLTAYGFTNDGQPFAGASCEEG